jgi:hypothetical protein
MTMAFCRVVLRGEGVEKDPESTTAFLRPPSECAGCSNQVCVQFGPRSQITSHPELARLHSCQLSAKDATGHV